MHQQANAGSSQHRLTVRNVATTGGEHRQNGIAITYEPPLGIGTDEFRTGPLDSFPAFSLVPKIGNRSWQETLNDRGVSIDHITLNGDRSSPGAGRNRQSVDQAAGDEHNDLQNRQWVHLLEWL